MTPQETVKWLKAIEEKYIHGGDEDFDEKRKIAINIAVAALEKQIPKKPKYIEGDYDMPLCPSCGMSVDENEEENYCSVCGQALDWSDTE